jgi:hypothetical protein
MSRGTLHAVGTTKKKPDTWTTLPQGRFTGIDWSSPESFRASDPYLAWAETSGFSGFRSPLGACAEPQWLPLLIELAPDTRLLDLLSKADAAWLQIPRVYQQLGDGLRFCTARAKRGFFQALQPCGALHGLVANFELGLPVGHHAQGIAPGARAKVASKAATPALKRLSGDVLVVIDNGLALGHADFLGPDRRTRVAAFWRQDESAGPHGRASASLHPALLDPARAGPPPADLGYGHELDQQAIQGAIIAHTRAGRLDEDGLYRHLQMWAMNHATHHGTHVTSLLAGPRTATQTIGQAGSPPHWQASNDPASSAALLVAQLDWTSVADSSGGALNVSLVEAMAWALSRCAPDARVAFNVSWGALAGPHNGTSLLERAMAQLIIASGLEAQLFVPAGNAYQARTHANGVLKKNKPKHLHWRVQPDDHSQSFLELWFEDRKSAHRTLKGLSITLTPPGAHHSLPAMPLGQSGVWPSVQAPQCAVMFPERSALGRPGVCAVIALAPTASWFGHPVLTQAGVWQVTLCHSQRRDVVFDAYIERDDVALGAADTGARQSHLESRRYDHSAGLHGLVDHPDNKTLVRRSGTFNDIATGPHTVAVGGTRFFHDPQSQMALYSPRLPDPDQARPARAQVKKVPDQFAMSDEHAALWGVRGAGTRSGAQARLVGTSMATPQVARRWL